MRLLPPYVVIALGRAQKWGLGSYRPLKHANRRAMAEWNRGRVLRTAPGHDKIQDAQERTDQALLLASWTDLKVADCKFGDETRRKRARRRKSGLQHEISGRCIWDWDRAGRKKRKVEDRRHDDEVWMTSMAEG